MGFCFVDCDFFFPSLLENGTIMNRSQFFKFGIKVAELVATMRPDPARAARRDAA